MPGPQTNMATREFTLKHLEHALGRVVAERFVDRNWNVVNNVHQIEMYLGLQLFDGIVDAIDRVSGGPAHSNGVVRENCAIIKPYIQHMCRDNPGLRDLYEPYSSRYSEELALSGVKQNVRRVERSGLFGDVQQAYARRLLTKLIVDRRMPYAEFEAHMLEDGHEEAVEEGRREVVDWQRGVQGALNTVAAMGLAERLNFALRDAADNEAGDNAVIAIDVDSMEEVSEEEVVEPKVKTVRRTRAYSRSPCWD